MIPDTFMEKQSGNGKTNWKSPCNDNDIASIGEITAGSG